MEFAILGAVVFLLVALFFVLAVQPLWSIVDCLLDPEKSVVAKIVWSLAIFFTGVLCGIPYSFIGARSPLLKKATLMGVILSIGAGAAACGLAIGTEQGRQWVASNMESIEVPAVDGIFETNEVCVDENEETMPVSTEPDEDSFEVFEADAPEPSQEIVGLGDSDSGSSANTPMPKLEKISASMDALSKLLEGNAEGALASVNASIRLDSTDLDSYILRARIHKTLGNTDEFNNDLLHVIRGVSTKVNQGEAASGEYFQRAQALQEFKKYDYALRDLKKAQELDPDSEIYAGQIKMIELQRKLGQ